VLEEKKKFAIKMPCEWGIRRNQFYEWIYDTISVTALKLAVTNPLPEHLTGGDRAILKIPFSTITFLSR